MPTGHRIREYVDVEKFREKIKHYPAENIQCTLHTFFRLGDKQRESFTRETLKRLLLEDTPVLVGVQNNGIYAVFYKHKKQSFIRIMVAFKPNRADIVTFYIINKEQLPR